MGPYNYNLPGMPKAKHVSNLAIVSDLHHGIPAVNALHKNGMNVLYANGAAKFIPLDVIKDDLDTEIVDASQPDQNFSSAYNNRAGIWWLWLDFDLY